MDKQGGISTVVFAGAPSSGLSNNLSSIPPNSGAVSGGGFLSALPRS
jgi:hypothetical protein